MNLEKNWDQFINLEERFRDLISEFESNADSLKETKEFAEINFPEIKNIWTELKEALGIRLYEVQSKVGQEKVDKALLEINVLLDVVIETLKSNLEGFGLSNNEDGSELISSTFKKIEKEGDKILSSVEVGFNFVATEHGQARVKFNYFDGEKDYSLRIDRDEERNKIFIDLDTTAVNEIFKDYKMGHHFESETLDEFVSQDKFRDLVENFKEILLEQREHFSVKDLIEKFRK